MYKPGQLVTIEGRVHRIRKATFQFGCSECSHRRKSPICCAKCMAKIPVDCYPELLIPKTSKV